MLDAAVEATMQAEVVLIALAAVASNINRRCCCCRCLLFLPLLPMPPPQLLCLFQSRLLCDGLMRPNASNCRAADSHLSSASFLCHRRHALATTMLCHRHILAALSHTSSNHPHPAIFCGVTTNRICAIFSTDMIGYCPAKHGYAYSTCRHH